MRVFKQDTKVVIEGQITDDPNMFEAELNVDKINILNTSTGLYEVFEILWSEIKDINNASLADASATKAYLDSQFKSEPKFEIDSEKRQVIRRATSRKGWHYRAICADVSTSSTAVYNKDAFGNDLNDVTVKMYSDETTETNDPLQCVKTVVTFSTAYAFEVIEGDLYHHTRPTEDVRVWTLAGATALGQAGLKTFVNGLNLKFMSPDDHIESDGRSSKYMERTTDIVVGVDGNGNPITQAFNTNEFQFVIKHSAGFSHDIMIILEIYVEG